MNVEAVELRSVYSDPPQKVLFIILALISFLFLFLFFISKRFSVVIVSLGATKKEMRTLDVVGGSPKHRASIVATSSMSMDATLDSECDISGSGGSVGGASSHYIQLQQSIDSSMSSAKAAAAASAAATAAEMADAIDIVAEPLDKILDNKLVKEKRLEMEKKLESMRKKHDKEKLRVTAQRSGDLTDGIRKSKFYMNNKLVKRLSSKNM